MSNSRKDVFTQREQQPTVDFGALFFPDVGPSQKLFFFHNVPFCFFSFFLFFFFYGEIFGQKYVLYLSYLPTFPTLPTLSQHYAYPTYYTPTYVFLPILLYLP